MDDEGMDICILYAVETRYFVETRHALSLQNANANANANTNTNTKNKIHHAPCNKRMMINHRLTPIDHTEPLYINST